MAELAGLPAQLLSEAKKKLEAMEAKPAGDREISKGREYSQKYSQDHSQGHSLWAADEAERKKEEPPYQQIYEEIRNIDLNQMTPLEALNYLSRLIDKLKKSIPMLDYLNFVLIFLIGLISPGPDFLIVTKNSITYGDNKTFLTVLGISVGNIFHAV